MRERFENIDEAVTWLNANQNDLVEVTIVSDTYLKSEDRRRLQDAHKGIIHIKPELRSDKNNTTNTPEVDLNKPITELFIDFFKFNKGQEPNEEILNIFKELLK